MAALAEPAAPAEPKAADFAPSATDYNEHNDHKSSKPIKSLISRFNDPKARAGTGSSQPLVSPRAVPVIKERAGAASVSGDTAPRNNSSEHADASPAPKQPHTGDVRQLQERCSKLEARLARQNAAVLEFENELQIYEAGVHQALLILGVDQGLRGLTSVTASEQLELCIRTLLDSESHLLNRTEEMNDEILQHKELEAAIMLKLNAYIVKEQEGSAPLATSEASATEAAASAQASAQNAQYIQELKLRSEQQDEELRELYAYSTQLLEKICEVQEENAGLRAQQESKDQAPVTGDVDWDTEKRALLTVIAAHKSNTQSPSSAAAPAGNGTLRYAYVHKSKET